MKRMMKQQVLSNIAGAVAGLAMAGAALFGAGTADASTGAVRLCLLKPDIVMERAQLQQVNGQTRVRVSFRNDGCPINTGFWSTVMIDTTTYYFYTPSMDGYSATVRVLNVAPVASGQHNLHVALDWHAGNLQTSVAESNEYNNYFGQTVVVP